MVNIFVWDVTLDVQKLLSDQLIDCRFVKTTHFVVLDYSVNVDQLSEEDQLLGYGELGNFSIFGVWDGFEQVCAQ